MANLTITKVTPTLLLTMGLLMSLPAGAEQGAYLEQSAGQGVRNSAGECWQTGAWEGESSHEDCNPAAAEQAAMEPEPAVAEVPEVTEPRKVVKRINLQSDANFAFDQANLSDQGRATLDQLVASIRGAQEPKLVIAGHADRIGSEQYNFELSTRRAQAVRQYLVAQGVPAEIIELVAKGELQPIVQCDQLNGQALIDCLAPNRRTEVEFSAFEVTQEMP